MRKAFKYFLKVGLRLTRSRELIRSRAGAGGTSKGKKQVPPKRAQFGTDG